MSASAQHGPLRRRPAVYRRHMLPECAGGFDCENRVDPTNCNLKPCQSALCGLQHDCEVVLNDNACPPKKDSSGNVIDCFAPQCTFAGCGLRDTCNASTPSCNGCAQCSCNELLKRRVPSGRS